jgi:hypothetical protein
MTHPTDTPDARDGRGRYIRTLETAQQDAEVARLYTDGSHTFQQIADQLGISKWAAIRSYQRAIREVVQGAGEEALKVQVDRLEYLFAQTIEVLETDHVVVSHGRVVKDDEGNPLIDSGPKLAAIREARANLESFRKLTGLDQPAKVQHSGGVTYELVGVDPEELV